MIIHGINIDLERCFGDFKVRISLSAGRLHEDLDVIQNL